MIVIGICEESLYFAHDVLALEQHDVEGIQEGASVFAAKALNGETERIYGPLAF